MSKHVNDPTVATYDRIARRYSQTHYSPRFWQREFTTFRRLVPGKRVLDIGCGAGRDAVLFSRYGFTYTGIDASRRMLAEARKRVRRARFILMNFYDLDFPRNSFDGFWAAASLLHIPKRRIRPVLRRVQMILKPQGIGFISIKAGRSLRDGFLYEEKYAGFARYFAFYSNAEFRRILRSCGFSLMQNHIMKEGNTRWLCYLVKKTI